MAEEKKELSVSEELFRRIREAAGLKIEDFQDLELPDHAVWFPLGAEGSPSLIKLSSALPMAPDFMVFSIFQSETEIRAYVIWNKGDAPLPPTVKMPLRRYCFSKAAPTYFCSNMMPDVFVQTIATEWLDIADILQTADEARQEQIEALQEYILGLSDTDTTEGLSQPAPVQAMLQRIYDDLESGQWEQEEEQDEEPAPPPPTDLAKPPDDAPPPPPN